MTDTGYQYFMAPEPREHLGPVKLEVDSILGTTPVRMARIGMTRNASERKEVKVYLKPFPHIRIDKAKPLQGWHKGKNPGANIRPRPCYTEALLTEPYGGFCPIGCIGCYINSGIRGYRGTGLITVPLNYGAQVRDQLATFYKGTAGYFTSFHDPFNPLEDFYHNTQYAAGAFIEAGLPIFFLSRLKYPQWAIDLLKQNKYSYAQKSINTPHEEDWKILSPGAISLKEHFDDIRRLAKAGIYVSIQVNPIIPGVMITEDLFLLFDKLAKAGAKHVIVKFIEAGYSWAPTMVARMKKHFGPRGDVFARLFNQNIGGQKAVDETYRMNEHKKLRSYATKVGLTYSTCYEYKYEKGEDGKTLSKTGISIGPIVITSAQCHGKRVPMFKRTSLDQPFKPLGCCPDTGCLYCSDGNGGKPKCGNELLGQASALRIADYRKPW